MNKEKIFKNITSGKFWKSGNIWFDQDKSRYLNREIKKLPNGPFSHLYAKENFRNWDLTSMAGKKYIYTADDSRQHYTDTSTLKPCLKQCMLEYLETEERQFLEAGFARATAALLKYCEKNYFHAFVLLTQPGVEVGLHDHKAPPKYGPITFTYIISSESSKPYTYLLNQDEQGEITRRPYPDHKEFFFIHNTYYNHGTSCIPEDENYYLYFIFDGVTVKDPDKIKTGEFYVHDAT